MSKDSHQSPQTAHQSLWLDKLQDAVDGEPASSDSKQLQAHLAECAACRNEYDRLLKLDGLLRNATTSRSPSAEFDRNLHARIAGLEAERRSQAKERELLEFKGRLARLRGGWREFGRFHLGNILGGVATIIAVVSSLAGSWATLGQGLRDSRLGALLIQQGVLESPLTIAVGVAAGFAAAAIVIIRRLERYGR